LNQTNSLIYQELKRQFPNPMDGANSPQALLVYSAVMGSDGIFGTDLEAEALSEDLKCPVWVYYREGGDYNGHPTRVFGAHFKGYPICLAFYRANKHYNLLVPKKPIMITNGGATSATFSFQEGGPQPVHDQPNGGEEDKNAVPPAAPAVAGATGIQHSGPPPPAAAIVAPVAPPTTTTPGMAGLTTSGRGAALAAAATGHAPTGGHHHHADTTPP
jgi:hypothetical protein